MKDLLKKLKPHLIISILFLIITFSYFEPMLQGKVLIGGDTVNWVGMSQDLREYKKKYNKNSFWSNSMFSGMPSYMTNGIPNIVAQKITSVFNFIPKPAGYMFFLFLSFYTLFLSFRVDYKLAFLGALMFGFSSYFLIIIGAGHLTKLVTIYFTIFLIAGINYIFDKKYISGFFLTSLFAILSLNSNHPQMSYYYSFSIFLLFILKGIEFVKKRELKHFSKSVILVTISAIIGILVHSSSLIPIKEYTEETIRGKANLTKEIKKNKTSGLDRDYITAWSYGKLESFNMFIPNLMGGGTETLGKNTKTYNEILKNYNNGQMNINEANTFLSYAKSYWGSQPFTEGPTYLGAVVIFLFVLGLFILRGRIKLWLILSTILSLMMAWGKNLEWFTDFMIDYFPLYNKFRAPASALVVAQMTVPLMAILSLKEFLDDRVTLEIKNKALKYSSIITLLICIVFGLGGLGILDYLGGSYDSVFEKSPKSIQEAIIIDRENIAKADSWRTFIFVLLAIITLFFYLKGKINYTKVLVIICLLSLVDMWNVGKRYLNGENFITKSKSKQLFVPSFANKEILKDTSYYRVMNTTKSIMSDSETPYWHNSIGGYHAAKLRRYQELYDNQILKKNMEVIDMLNVKYIIIPDQKTGDRAVINTEANGNVWIVDKYIYAQNSDEEMKILDTLKTKKEVVIDKEFKDILGEEKLKEDKNAYVKLISNNLQELKYEYFSEIPQIVVFSEIYYKQGWKAYVDGVSYPYFRANYILRAMKIEGGNHEIVFKFEPNSIRIGKIYSNIGYGLFLVSFTLLIAFRKKKHI